MDLEKLVKNFKLLWKTIFGGEAPQYVITTAVIAAAVFAAVFLAVKVIKELRPLWYDADAKRRVKRRRQFADHIESEIRRINLAEAWNEHRFAELEAEVEAEGARRLGWFSLRRAATLRREKSLSQALRTSEERLILLEGDPGSGKSVALRHLAKVMASVAMRSRRSRTPIPLYINLKSMEREPETPIDAELIRSHIMKTLNRPNSRDIEAFLDDEFGRGLEEGTWLFLFDSFDEMPDVLSATSAETFVRQYGEAIADFLTSMNQCRGIIASRYFRGPGSLNWPRFRILALSDEYRRNLIRRADLKDDIERELIGQLELGRPELAVTARNPMFLGLLCEYMRSGNAFPNNTHVVFEDYVSTRLSHDEGRLLRRFGAGATAVRQAAEVAAFCMASHPTLGLSPTRQALADAMKERGYEGDAPTMFDALVFIKLAREEEEGPARTFTFAHRRFQEYFATCVVLDAPEIVTADTLLTDGRWRETAVVLLQTQSGNRLNTILEKASILLRNQLTVLVAAFPDSPALGSEDARPSRRHICAVPWPPLTLHLLSLLQSGYQGRPSLIPAEIQELTDQIVSIATMNGTLADRKWVLEVAGVSSPAILTAATQDAFRSGSRWLSEVAYRQVALLPQVPPDVAGAIRASLVRACMTGRMRREREATLAYLQRLPDKEQYVRVAQLLLNVFRLDIAWHVAFAVIAIPFCRGPLHVSAVLIAIFASVFVSRAAARVVFDSESDPLSGALFFYLAVGARIAPVFVVTDTSIWVTGTALIAISWAPFALVAASYGRFTRLAFWPFFSIYLLLVLLDIRLLAQVTRKYPSATILFLMTLVLTATYFYVDLPPVVAKTIEITFWIATTALLSIFAVITIPAAAGVIGLFRSIVRDMRSFYREIRNRSNIETADTLVKRLLGLELMTTRARLLRHVREKSLLEMTAENELILRQTAVDWENESTADRQQRRQQQGTQFKQILGRLLTNRRYQPMNSVRAIEELYILADQIRSRLAS